MSPAVLVGSEGDPQMSPAVLVCSEGDPQMSCSTQSRLKGSCTLCGDTCQANH